MKNFVYLLILTFLLVSCKKEEVDTLLSDSKGYFEIDGKKVDLHYGYVFEYDELERFDGQTWFLRNFWISTKPLVLSNEGYRGEVIAIETYSKGTKFLNGNFALNNQNSNLNASAGYGDEAYFEYTEDLDYDVDPPLLVSGNITITGDDLSFTIEITNGKLDDGRRLEAKFSSGNFSRIRL